VFRIASRKPDVSYALFSYQNGMVVSLGHEGNEIAYAPKRIDCYAVTQENFGLGENGTKFKLTRGALSSVFAISTTPRRRTSISYRYATPLLGEFSKHDPGLRERLREPLCFVDRVSELWQRGQPETEPPGVPFGSMVEVLKRRPLSRPRL